MTKRPILTISAFTKVCKMKAFRLELRTMHINPARKYAKVISDFSSSTLTASFAEASPSLPLKNFPGPKTEHVAEFRIAQSSSPIAQAVIER